MGWLHATPETQVEKGKVQRWPYDRLGHYAKLGQTPPHVEIKEGQYLFDAMVALRPIRQDGMGGLHVVDWQELEAFAVATEAIQESWEKRLVMEMCISYLNGHIEGKNPLSIPPVERDDG